MNFVVDHAGVGNVARNNQGGASASRGITRDQMNNLNDAIYNFCKRAEIIMLFTINPICMKGK